MADRPTVWINMAASLDGRVAGPGGRPVRLSDDADLARVHAMRADADAILVGAGTVAADDPSLRVQADRLGPEHRAASVRDPLRVILDPDGRLPAASRVFDGKAPSLRVLADGGPADPDGGAPRDHVRVPRGPGGLDLEAVLAALAERDIATVMVEGGPRVAASFLTAGLWDRFTLYVAPRVLGDGVPLWPTGVKPLAWSTSVRPAGRGVLWTFEPTR